MPVPPGGLLIDTPGIRELGFTIGLRPRFNGDVVAEGAAAGFEVIAVDLE